MKKIIFSIAIFLSVFLPATTLAKYDFYADSGLSKSAAQTGHTANNAIFKTDSPQTVIARLINILLSLLGVIFMCLAFYGGFIWLTSQGNTSNIEKAKKILTNASIGIALVFSAYIITAFIMQNLPGELGGGQNNAAPSSDAGAANSSNAATVQP